MLNFSAIQPVKRDSEDEELAAMEQEVVNTSFLLLLMTHLWKRISFCSLVGFSRDDVALT